MACDKAAEKIMIHHLRPVSSLILAFNLQNELN